MKKREFIVGDLVLLDSSRLCWLLGKLKSKRTVLYLITQVIPHGKVQLKTKEVVWFKVNGEQIKLYIGRTASLNILLIGLKFEGTSPGNSVENHFAIITEGHMDGPSRTRWTIA